MQIKMTNDQARQMFLNAINASCPVALGFLHFEEKDYTLDDVMIENGRLEADYFRGRMVKLGFLRIGQDVWKITRPLHPPNSAYQSWVGTYPDLKSLVDSVGGLISEPV